MKKIVCLVTILVLFGFTAANAETDEFDILYLELVLMSRPDITAAINLSSQIVLTARMQNILGKEWDTQYKAGWKYYGDAITAEVALQTALEVLGKMRK